MKNKGFTLAELLGVIVILGILALITVPIISDFINESEISSAEKSAENYINAVDDTIMSNKLISEKMDGRYLITSNGDLCPEEEVEGEIAFCLAPTIVEAEGNRPVEGLIVIKNLKVDKASSQISFKKYTVTYNEEEGRYIASKDYSPIVPIPNPKSFDSDSWSTIAANVKVGNLSVYKVGDTKEVTLTGDLAGTYTVRIANTSTPEECASSDFSHSACGFVVEFIDIITIKGMNSTNTNKGGWEASEMRTYLNGTVFNCLPTELKDSIINTRVVSSHGNSSGESDFITNDQLYLFETKEVTDDRGYNTAASKTRKLDYYREKNVSTYNNTPAIKKYNNAAAKWWLRSAFKSNNEKFDYMNVDGGWIGNTVCTNCGVAPAFRIG